MTHQEAIVQLLSKNVSALYQLLIANEMNSFSPYSKDKDICIIGDDVI